MVAGDRDGGFIARVWKKRGKERTQAQRKVEKTVGVGPQAARAMKLTARDLESGGGARL